MIAICKRCRRSMSRKIAVGRDVLRRSGDLLNPEHQPHKAPGDCEPISEGQFMFCTKCGVVCTSCMCCIASDRLLVHHGGGLATSVHRRPISQGHDMTICNQQDLDVLTLRCSGLGVGAGFAGAERC
jgi:hypothetical protein